MERNEVYYQLIQIAEKKSSLLETVGYDPELAKEDSGYMELITEEAKLLEEIKKVEYEEIINNSFLFAYDQSLTIKENKEFETNEFLK